MIENHGENVELNPSASESSRIDTLQFRYNFTQNQDQTRRLAFHFINDALPKFVLSSCGTVINANARAEALIQQGLISSGRTGKLDYGNSDYNKSVGDILANLNAGRTSCAKLLKRLPDENWVVFEFTTAKYLGDKEIVLTVKQCETNHQDGFNAISKAFNLTLTEMDVIKCMSMALCPKDIGQEMQISVNTVRSHLRSIYSKIGVRGYNKALRLILQLLR